MAAARAARARLEVAGRYVELANGDDRKAVRALFASPCDMFGEAIAADEIDRYLDTDQDETLRIIAPPCLADGDEYTVLVDYVRSWSQDGLRLEETVGEFMTFTHGKPLVVRRGYAKPASPAVLARDLRPQPHRKSHQSWLVTHFQTLLCA